MNSITLCALLMTGISVSNNLVPNPGFEITSDKKGPSQTVLTGSAVWTQTGYNDEETTSGVALESGVEPKSGSVSQMVKLNPEGGKWVKFSFRGLAEENFAVDGDQLGMMMSFYSKDGTKFLEKTQRLIYREILKDRKDLDTNGIGKKDGAAVWRTYELEEFLPFAETDSVKVEVTFQKGAAKAFKLSAFIVDDFSLVQTEKSSDGKVDPKTTSMNIVAESLKGMTPLGGKWYYQTKPGEQIDAKNLTVTEANSSQLFYLNDRITAVFAGNMTATMRPGFLDEQGNLVQKSSLLKDNVTILFNGTSMTIKTKGIPNHPTAKFPDKLGTQFYNPNYIQAKTRNFVLPLNPKKSTEIRAMQGGKNDGALPMGPIGVAINGVVFFNPFDAGSMEAVNIMDRCCGHPAPDNQYHYHKYPICVNTPFVDKGEFHSPIIGFALDGFPVYGPYEGKNDLARDSKIHPIDEFNAHFDEARGWHYHVTPGKFPYIIGGYLGTAPRRGPAGPRG